MPVLGRRLLGRPQFFSQYRRRLPRLLGKNVMQMLKLNPLTITSELQTAAAEAIHLHPLSVSGPNRFVLHTSIVQAFTRYGHATEGRLGEVVLPYAGSAALWQEGSNSRFYPDLWGAVAGSSATLRYLLREGDFHRLEEQFENDRPYMLRTIEDQTESVERFNAYYPDALSGWFARNLGLVEHWRNMVLKRACTCGQTGCQVHSVAK